ncbi:hypothetical protein TNCV_4686051 [Trichonephila clavipes]|nr:hypothetical protein TNCV_4686051 [Trichonephila clavipes]
MVQPPSGEPLQFTPPYTISISTVPRLNTRSSFYLGKWITNEELQQDWCSRNLPFSVIYRKTAWGRFRQEFHAASLSDLPRRLLEIIPNTYCSTTVS